MAAGALITVRLSMSSLPTVTGIIAISLVVVMAMPAGRSIRLYRPGGTLLNWNVPSPATIELFITDIIIVPAGSAGVSINDALLAGWPFEFIALPRMRAM